jgi:hypothetical protein
MTTQQVSAEIHEPKLTALALEAGFSSVALAAETPLDHVYELRPQH